MGAADLYIKEILTVYGSTLLVTLVIVSIVNWQWVKFVRNIYRLHLVGFEAECAELAVNYKKRLFAPLNRALSNDEILRSERAIRLLEIGVKTASPWIFYKYDILYHTLSKKWFFTLHELKVSILTLIFIHLGKKTLFTPGEEKQTSIPSMFTTVIFGSVVILDVNTTCLLVLPRYVIYYFCPPAGKPQLSVRCAKRSCHVPATSSRKIVYTPWPVNKKASDHMFIDLGFASVDNSMASETFLTLLATVCLLLLSENIQFYPDRTHLICVDWNRKLEEYLTKSDRAWQFSHVKFEKLIIGDGRSLKAIPSNCVDAVVTVRSLCSCSSVRETLREIRRILAPGGKYFFLEHIPDNDETFTRWLQGFLTKTKIYPSLFGDCRLDSNPLSNIKTTGFLEVSWESIVLRGYVTHPCHLYLTRNHIMGTATK